MSGNAIEPRLGRLSVVEARQVWPHEALNFTPWLLDNVDVLSELLGMDLVLEEAEHAVGDFSLDLKGFDQSSGEVVIVENQLEQSDHGHLGQIITYAAGTEAATIVWIATAFRAEHRAAIDWLNQRTDENTRFFAVVIHVVRIGDSEPAPNFELAAQPNDWEKQVKAATRSMGETSIRQSRFREFWAHVLPAIRAAHPSWTRRRTSQQPFLDTLTGLQHLAGSMVWTREGLVSQLYFQANDPLLATARFEHLYEKRDIFELALGEIPTWDRMDGRKACRISLFSNFKDIDEVDQWNEMTAWLIDTQARFRAAIDVAGGLAEVTGAI